MPTSRPDLISQEYIDAQLAMREQTPDWGSRGYKHAEGILELAIRMRCGSILDYGSGTGSLEKHIRKLTGCPVYSYDPVFGPYEAKAADLVACTDVLEHIEPDKLRNVLDHIWGLAGKCVYFAIATRYARIPLPDGRNPHLIVHEPEWWIEQLSTYPWCGASPATIREGYDVTFYLEKGCGDVEAAA